MLVVEEIEEGTVIDHILAGRGLRVLEILGIGENYRARVALVMNVPSKRMGKKDIVKIEGKFIDEKSANRIAVVAPEASLNIIKEGKVVEKRNVKLPSKLVGVFKCPNSKCITNAEHVETVFGVEPGPKMRCAYCERLFAPDELGE